MIPDAKTSKLQNFKISINGVLVFKIFLIMLKTVCVLENILL